MSQDNRLKQRLTGAVVLLALAVILLPLLFSGGPKEVNEMPRNVPPRPGLDAGSALVRLDEAPERVESLQSETPPPVSAPPDEPESAPAPQPVPEPEPAPTPAPPAPTAPTPAPPAPAAQTAPSFPPPPQMEGFIVQLGSFRQESNAANLVRQVEQHGYPVFVTESGTTAETRALRVRVGPRPSVAEAQQLRDELQQRLNIRGIVLPYQP